MPLGLFPASGTPGCFGFGLVHAVGLPRYLWGGLLWAGLERLQFAAGCEGCEVVQAGRYIAAEDCLGA